MDTRITEPATPSVRSSDWLDHLVDRSMKLISLSVDAVRGERYKAYIWLIREYRRNRIAWDESTPVAEEERGKVWGVSANEYRIYLKQSREFFGLPVDAWLVPLSGADDRRAALIKEYEEEMDSHIAQFDPYYRPVGSNDLN